jgi:hypothetical protein
MIRNASWNERCGKLLAVIPSPEYCVQIEIERQETLMLQASQLRLATGVAHCARWLKNVVGLGVDGPREE